MYFKYIQTIRLYRGMVELLEDNNHIILNNLMANLLTQSCRISVKPQNT